ncbi:MAG: DUF4350 domain-containing protein [Betaproteobacteria bacterium]
MTRRIVWITVALIVLFGLGGLWFMDTFEQRPVKTHTPPESEARRNPYLALERFMGRMGRPFKPQGDVRFLDALPPGGVVILDVNRRAQMTPARIDRLLAWVERGGYLIAAAELPGLEDPVLARFQVSRWGEAQKKPPIDDDEDDEASPANAPPAAGNTSAGNPHQCAAEDQSATPAATPPPQVPAPAPAPSAPAAALASPPKPGVPAKRASPPRSVQVQLPGAARPLNAAHYYPGLKIGRLTPAWTAGAPDFGAQFVHFSHGAGHVTFVSGLPHRFSNRGIGAQDHAELLWSLLQTYQPDGAKPVYLLTRLTVPRLWEWLVERAGAVLVAGLALLLLWLWRVIPRFGPPQLEPEPDRRQLREHLTALGLFVWRRGGLDHWLKVAREAFQARLALRHPTLAGLPPAEQAEALSQLSSLSPARIAAALQGPAGSASEFTHTLRTLRNLERSL